MAALSILIVDDDVDLADGLAELLELQGHRVEIAANGREGVTKFANGAFDIVFMDVRMPVLNGVDSYLEIRKLNPQAKVVMMTGHQESIVAKALEAGALDLLRKPLSAERILESLRDATRPVALVSNDDPTLVKGLSDMLALKGLKTVVAETEDEALRQAARRDFDVLVLDLKLPVLAGLRTYEDIARLSAPPHTVIVANEAHDRWPAIEVLARLPIDGILPKPIDPGSVLESLASILSGSAASPAKAACN